MLILPAETAVSEYMGVRMTRYREILRLLSLHLKTAEIVRSCRVSTKTIAIVRKRASELDISWPLPEGMTEEKLATVMFPGKGRHGTDRHLPDMARVMLRLYRDGASRTVIWNEYLDECGRLDGKPLMYSRFCHYICEELLKRRGAAGQTGIPGRQAETVWISGGITVADSASGKPVRASLLVAALSFSGYAFAMAFPDVKVSSRIRAYVRMLEHFGGVTKLIEVDRVHASRKNQEMDQELGHALQEFAEHYGTAVITEPRRGRKGSAAWEGGAAENAAAWLMNALRGESFSSFDALNLRIRERMSEYNSLPGAEGAAPRDEIFRKDEKPLLSPLPPEPYEYALWTKGRVQKNGYIVQDYMRYSVPRELAGKEVDVRLTDTSVEIFSDGRKAASHRRLYGRKGQYSTVSSHRCSKTESTGEWDEEGLLRWAGETGESARKIACSILKSHSPGNDALTACRLFLMLSKIYTPARLEEACRRALEQGGSPDYWTVRRILSSALPGSVGKLQA